MLNKDVTSKVQDALYALIKEWGDLKVDGEENAKRNKEIVRQYNQLMDFLLDWGFDPYRDYLDVTEMLPDTLMSKRYLIAAKQEIPPNHASYE